MAIYSNKMNRKTYVYSVLGSLHN